MSILKANTPLKSFFYVLFAFAFIFSVPAAQAQIMGTLSNFDVHNDQDDSMTNLELDIRNIYPYQIFSTYDGPNAWGTPAIIRDIGGSEVTWADFRRPILPGEMYHFGLEIDPNAPFPCGVQAYWTQHLKVIEIPVPWQTWRPEPEQVVDVIHLSTDFAEPVIISREFISTDFRIPLDDLVWDNSTLAPLWQPVTTDPVVLNPGDVVELPIPVLPIDLGVYVRYTVALASNPDNIITRFVNEAEIETLPIAQIPSIVGSLSNFDAHNDTGKPVHDLELDILNVTPADVWGWYNAADAWGLHPVTNDPHIGTIPGGIEVNWVDEWNPIKYCETKHFGLYLNPNTPEPLVRAYWTRMVKVRQIPVPWQWWQIYGGPEPIVTDVIQLSDTFDGPVTITREWATVPSAIPLDNLTWGTPGVVWNSVPTDPIDLDPGFQSFFDILASPSDAAVLMRYTVKRAGTVDIETRFINEAILDWSMGPDPVIIGWLSNFDVVNLDDRNFTNLELDIRGIGPDQIWDWYKGQFAWGLHPTGNNPIIDPLPQTEVTWAAFTDPLPHCETRHFGVELASDALPPCGVQAYWTQHKKIVEIPVPWQTWRPEFETVVDVITLSPDYPESIIISRERAVTNFTVPLNDLNWDNPTIPWIPVSGDPVVLLPGDSVELWIPVAPGDQGVYVRYTVANETNPENIITRFTNEAMIEVLPTAARQFPSIIGELSNFDAHNDTGKPVHDLEFDIRNISPEDILDWYRGPDAWGIDPVIRLLPDGITTEVTWIDDAKPIPHCETRHFGLELVPGAPEPLVRAFWTREVKVAQIPVPWQFWIMPDGPFIRDVIQLSDTFIEPVIVRREFATQDTLVALNDLNWDLAADWQTDPAGPIIIDPGFQADLDIEITPDDAAVLVRYEVELASSGALVTRFTNEAMLGPGVVTGLVFQSNKTTMDWNPSPLAGTVFDILWGDIPDLRTDDGIDSATCLQNDWGSPNYNHPLPPTPDGYYYLVRSQNGTSYGTYDTTTDPTTREGRDAEVVSDCP